MKIRIQSILTTLLFVLTISNLFGQAKKKADKATVAWRYEIEAVGVGVQGTYLVKVWSYSKNKDVAMEQCKKNAIHGIVFKGFSGNDKVRTSQKPLASNPTLEVEKGDFFSDFFETGGKYMKFVTVSDASREIIQVGKEYKVGVVLSVNVSELRKDLEAAGILRGLSNGF
jgi:hypothetical protein